MATAGVAIGFQKLTQQKLGILAEAERAGARLVAAWDVGQYEHQQTSARWQALTRGGMAISSEQVFVFETAGVRHMFVQPYGGEHALPGVHHLWIRGGLRAPALFSAERRSFYTGNDPALGAWLDASPVAHVLRSIDWDYRIGTSTRVNDDTALQIRAMGNDVSHVVIRAHGENGINKHDVGFFALPRVATAFAQLVAGGMPPQPFFVDAPHADEYERLVMNQLPLPQPAAPYDLSAQLLPLLATLKDHGLVRAPVPQKKERGARTGIIPAWLADAPLLALRDDTVFGGGSLGTALLPTHLCVATDEGKIAIAYADITGASAISNMLALRSRWQGDLSIRLLDAEAFAAFFASLAHAAQRSA
jgi:hypothetical protein